MAPGVAYGVAPDAAYGGAMNAARFNAGTSVGRDTHNRRRRACRRAALARAALSAVHGAEAKAVVAEESVERVRMSRSHLHETASPEGATFVGRISRVDDPGLRLRSYIGRPFNPMVGG